MPETAHEYYLRWLSEEEAWELDGHKDTMRSTAPSSVKGAANARIKVLISKAEANRARAEAAQGKAGGGR